MNITINEQPIDYTLESETTLGDVVGELERWLGEAGMQIRSIARDGDDLDLASGPTWRALSVGDVGQVDVVAVTPHEFRAEKLQSLHGYFSTLRDAMDGSVTASDESLAEGLLEERESVAELLADVLDPEAGQAFLEAVGADGSEGLIDFSTRIAPVIEDRWREVVDPVASLTAAIPALRESIDDLAEVSAYLQNGEDSRAMARVLRFLELGQKLMRLLASIGAQRIIDLENVQIHDTPLSEYQAKLSGFLGELSGAISDGDIITVGDLLEYEIGPGFSDLIDALETGEVPR